MLHRASSFILAVTFSLGAVSPAEAKTIRCDAIFQPTVRDVIEQVNRDSGEILFQGKAFQEYTQNLSWVRKRKIRRLVQDIEVRSFPSEKALARHVVELGEVMFGSNSSMLQWVRKSSEQRLDDSAILLIKEQLMKEGLLNTWGDVNDPSQVSYLRVVRDKLGTFRESMIGQVIRFPYQLPKIKNQQIPHELMMKVVRDGFNKHAEEVRVALNQQTKIDAYNTFRKIYSPIFFGVILIVQAQASYQQLQDAIELQVRETIKALREQRKQIEETIPLFKQQEFEKAYAASIVEFTEKWGEPPTTEEAAIIRAKVEKGLNMH